EGDASTAYFFFSLLRYAAAASGAAITDGTFGEHGDDLYFTYRTEQGDVRVNLRFHTLTPGQPSVDFNTAGLPYFQIHFYTNPGELRACASARIRAKRGWIGIYAGAALDSRGRQLSQWPEPVPPRSKLSGCPAPGRGDDHGSREHRQHGSLCLGP